MKFQFLKENSTASNIHYITGEVSCLYHEVETDKKFRIKFRCPVNRGCFFSTTPGPLVNNAKCSLENLGILLNINANGKYILEPGKNLFESIQSGSVIALGLNSNEFPYLASIRMPGVLRVVGPTFIAVPVRSESDVALDLISDQEWAAENFKFEHLLKLALQDKGSRTPRTHSGSQPTENSHALRHVRGRHHDPSC